MDNPLKIARLSYAGVSVVLLFYGVFFTLSVICLNYLLTKAKRNWIVLGYTVTSLVVSTIWLVSSTKFTQLILIESAVNPVPTARLISKLDLLSQVVYSVQIWLADSLLIYRLWVIWGGSYLIILFPCVLYTGVVGAGITGLALYQHTLDKQNLIIHLGVSFHACSVGLNVTATSLIAGRLLYRRNAVKKLGGDSGAQYLSILAVFAESGALYSITGLIYIPLYATSSPYIFVFAAVLQAAASIAPALILLRMALGVAVTRHDQAPDMSTLNFGGGQNRKPESITGLSGTAFGGPTETVISSHKFHGTTLNSHLTAFCENGRLIDEEKGEHSGCLSNSRHGDGAISIRS